MNSLLKRLLLLSLFALPALSYGQTQRIQLTVDQDFQGRSTIPLKQLIQQQHPRVQLNQMQLLTASVQAKSAAGQGQMALAVGGSTTPAQTIGGNPRDFHNWNPRSFSVYQFQAPASSNPLGAWQIHTQGNIKVSRLILQIVPNRVTPPRRMQSHDLGNTRFQKIIETSEVVRINNPRVKTIQFTAQRNMIEVIEARAILNNGDEIFLDGLTGFYRQDSSKKLELEAFNGENIRSLVIRAISPNLFGSRGEVNVTIGSFQ